VGAEVGVPTGMGDWAPLSSWQAATRKGRMARRERRRMVFMAMV